MRNSILPRATLVRQVIRLVAELQLANGDSPDEGQEYRDDLMRQLRSLAIPLWMDNLQAD